MNDDEATLLLGALPAFGGAWLTDLVFALGLAIWARWVARRLGGAGWRRLVYLPLLAPLALLLGLGGTVAGLVHSFSAVADIAPEEKARALAAGIQSAMVFTMVGLTTAMAASVVSFVACVVGTLRKPTPPSAG